MLENQSMKGFQSSLGRRNRSVGYTLSGFKQLNQHNSLSCAGHRPVDALRVNRLVTKASEDAVVLWPKSPIPSFEPRKVKLDSLANSKLEISIYPTFSYDPSGGGGFGKATYLRDSLWELDFDIQNTFIPDLNYDTTSIIGIPLPPFLKIEIRLQGLKGTVDVATGECNLTMDSEFAMIVDNVPWLTEPLFVQTKLTTETSSGIQKTAKGSRLKYGRCKLVGVATVPKVNSPLYNAFLMLPSDALAVLNCTIDIE